MSKKKLKKMMMTKASRSPAMAQSSENDMSTLENLMANVGEAIFTVYRVSNGYNVCCYHRKKDKTGHTTDSRHDIIFVSDLNEIPKIVMGNDAAHKVMGY